MTGLSAHNKLPSSVPPKGQESAIAPRVLIVEDEIVTALAIRYQLEKEGYEIIDIAHSGKEAIYVIRYETPDIVIIDIYMPGVDGVETIRQLMVEIPTCFIVLTASTEDEQRTLDAGAMDYQVKPPIPRKFSAVLKRAQRRFEFYMKLRHESKDLEKTMQEWRLVRSILRKLDSQKNLREDEIFEQIEQVAEKYHLVLADAAQLFCRA